MLSSLNLGSGQDLEVGLESFGQGIQVSQIPWTWPKVGGMGSK